jgi:Holliday junction DNA helicase RuvA
MGLVLSTLQYYEGNPGGGILVPRLVGFLSDSEREFFELFTTVKGMGIRKALKAMAMPVSTIATAIEQADHKTLGMLQGIGQRTAQQIIAELKGKVGRFASETARLQPAASRPFLPYQAEALEVLVAWGEKRSEAMELIELAARRYPDVKTAEELVPLVYRLKQGIEV